MVSIGIAGIAGIAAIVIGNVRVAADDLAADLWLHK